MSARVGETEGEDVESKCLTEQGVPTGSGTSARDEQDRLGQLPVLVLEHIPHYYDTQLSNNLLLAIR